MRVYGYARVSTLAQQEGYSLDEQKERIESYCRAMGWQLLKVFIDGGESGAKLDRPALQDMCRQIKECEKVVVYKLDRLSRSQKDTLYLIEDVFLKNGVDFVSITENFDTATPFGKAMVGMLAVFAQLEREQIKERMMMGKAARAKEGKYCGQFRTAIGYEYINGELVVNEQDATQIRMIYDWVIRGMSFNSIAFTLNEQGFAHRYGKWSRETVRSVLRNRIYLGEIRCQGEFIRGNHEPIIDQETFDRATAIADKRTSKFAYSMNPGKATSYLGGLLVCAECGMRFYRRDDKGRSKYRCHGHAELPKGSRCTSRIWLREELDNIVLNEVRKLKLDNSLKTKRKSVNYDAEIAKVDSQLERLIDLYSLGNIPMEKLTSRTADLNERKASLIKQRDEKHLDPIPIIKSFDDIIKRGTVQEVRAVLFELIDRIVLDGDAVNIFWRF